MTSQSYVERDSSLRNTYTGPMEAITAWSMVHNNNVKETAA